MEVRSHSENDDHVSDHRENRVYKQEVTSVLWLYESQRSRSCLFSGRGELRKSCTKPWFSFFCIVGTLSGAGHQHFLRLAEVESFLRIQSAQKNLPFVHGLRCFPKPVKSSWPFCRLVGKLCFGRL